MKNKAGFTLIELLVVVGIIGLLAAMLLPVISKARNRARTATCQGNLKQFGLAIQTYVSDYNEVIPYLEDSNGVSWRSYLYEYQKVTEVYDCPADVFRQNDGSEYVPYSADSNAAGWTSSESSVWSSYGANGVHTAAGGSNPPFVLQDNDPFNVSNSLIDPTSVVMLTDGVNDTSKPHAVWFDGNGAGFTRSSVEDDTGLNRHDQKQNYLFFDGHVQLESHLDVSCESDNCWWTMNNKHGAATQSNF